MNDLYAQSIFAITRAGAMTLAELSQHGIPQYWFHFPMHKRTTSERMQSI